MSTQDNRKKLIIIAAWFLIPLALATIWYKVLPKSFLPSASTNNGELLDPIFTLDKFTQQTAKGEIFTNVEIEKIWTLVHFVQGECDEQCSQSLYKTRQLRISMGKDIDRLNRIAVLKQDGISDSNQKMWASHPDLEVLIASRNGVGAQIKSQVKNIQISWDSIFLVDPLGNVMMHFPASMEAKLIKKDIRKLLKLSHIG
jgi:hypothetical protein